MKKLRNYAASQNKRMTVTEIAARSGFPELPDMFSIHRTSSPRAKRFYTCG